VREPSNRLGSVAIIYIYIQIFIKKNDLKIKNKFYRQSPPPKKILVINSRGGHEINFFRKCTSTFEKHLFIAYIYIYIGEDDICITPSHHK
jgi:hypothetical protein